MPIHLAEIKAFLNRPGIEGPQALFGYIPCRRISDGKGRNYVGHLGTETQGIDWPAAGDPSGYTAMGVSGVTIATGVDLGQTDEDTLRRYGLDPGIVPIVRPYLGLRTYAAMEKLHDMPLAVSRDTADALDLAILSVHAKIITARYNRDNPPTLFEDLPWQAQAAIFSLLFQRGTGVAEKAPKTWAAFQLGAWADASARLCTADAWDGYQERRRLEGLLLREIA